MGDVQPASACGWSMAGGCPGRTGAFPKAVKLDPRPRRTLPAYASVQATIVFDPSDRALVADMAGAVSAFDPDGRSLWRRTLTGGVSASPAVDGSAHRVFVGTHAGWVYSLDTIRGEMQWQRQIPTHSDARIVSDLLFVPGRQWIVLSSWGGRYCALSAATGEVIRTWDAGVWPQAAASADRAGDVYCLRAVSGAGVEFVRVPRAGAEIVLHRQAEGDRGARRALVAAAPVVDDSAGLAYIVANEDRGGWCHAWSLEKGTLQWSHHLDYSVAATPALRADGVLLVADLAGDLWGLTDGGTPSFRYRTGCEYLIDGPVTEAGGQAFLPDPLGRLHRVTRDGQGQVVFEAERSIQAPPSFDSHGSLFVPGAEGRLHVFRNRQREP